MVKDRLIEMQKLAGETEPSSSTDIGNGNYSYHRETEALLEVNENFMENFLVSVTAQRKQMDELGEMLKRMRKIEGELLQAPASDQEKAHEHERLIQTFKLQSSSIRNALRHLEKEAERLEKEHPNQTGQIKILRTQLVDCTRTLSHMINQFQAQEASYAENLRKKFAAVFKVRGMQLSDEDMADLMQHGDISEKTKGLILAQREKEELYQEVKLRRDGLIEIEKSIHELSEMFVDLANLITSQGEIIDRISFNVENTKEYAEKARQNVDEAKRLQASTRKKKIIVFIFIVILLVILFIFLQGLVCHFTPIC
ncbi:unnamed protein product, partial [Mesorhabditis belari]|uniref:t-SNARE coiled-coil homology domain-containing protein n=1 Tax=Mesorhabditis belari TaxID=2138241 RepID=A0AAF3EH78_9BILA